MNPSPKRPLSVTLIACIFLAAGSVGFLYHASKFNPRGPVQFDLLLASFVRLVAVVASVFVLRGKNWARWLLAGWIGYHAALSAFHTPLELAVHGVLFAVVAFFLFRRPASNYFQHEGLASAGSGNES